MSNDQKFYGKYRGTVFNNNDPEQRGRLKLTVPDVFQDNISTWAEACAPLSGPSGLAMGFYMVPPVNAGVWVEFEQGDPDHPIWTGCRWHASGDVPKKAMEGNPSSPNIVLQTLGQHSVVISDLPGPAGGLTLKSTSGASINVSDAGIFIKNGKGASIVMTGPSVNINNGALVIT